MVEMLSEFSCYINNLGFLLSTQGIILIHLGIE